MTLVLTLAKWIETFSMRRDVRAAFARSLLLPWEHIENGTGKVIHPGTCFSIISTERRTMATFLHYSYGGIPDTPGAKVIFFKVMEAYLSTFGAGKIPVDTPEDDARFTVIPVALFRSFFATGPWSLVGDALRSMQVGTWFAILKEGDTLDHYIEFDSGIPIAL